MRSSTKFLLILLNLVLASGCGPQDFTSSVGSASDKGSGSERTSDGTESVPGYLSDLALIGFEAKGDGIRVFGKPGAIVGAKGIPTADTSIIILDVETSQFIKVSAELDEANKETRDIGDTDQREPLDPDDDVSGLSLMEADKQIIYGDVVATTRSKRDGSFEVTYKRPPGSENPFVVTIGQEEGTSFAFLQKKSSKKIVAVFGSLTKYLKTSKFTIFDRKAVTAVASAAPSEMPTRRSEDRGSWGDDGGGEGTVDFHHPNEGGGYVAPEPRVKETSSIPQQL